MSVDELIRKNLGEKTLQRIEQRMFERYQISLNESILEFEKFDTVLREFFGEGAEGLEQRIFQSLKKTK